MQHRRSGVRLGVLAVLAALAVIADGCWLAFNTVDSMPRSIARLFLNLPRRTLHGSLILELDRTSATPVVSIHDPSTGFEPTRTSDRLSIDTERRRAGFWAPTSEYGPGIDYYQFSGVSGNLSAPSPLPKDVVEPIRSFLAAQSPPTLLAEFDLACASPELHGGSRENSAWIPGGILHDLLAFAAFMTAVLAFRASLRHGRAARRLAQACCPKCGYSLRGLSQCRCPECGNVPGAKGCRQG